MKKVIKESLKNLNNIKPLSQSSIQKIKGGTQVVGYDLTKAKSL